MRYTQHFSAKVKEFGPPQLDVHQFKTFMNIVATESRIAALEKVNASFANTPYAFKMSLELSKAKKTLAHLTLNLSPETLLEELVKS